MTSGVQLWSQHGTDVALAVALLLLLVLLGWAGRRKSRRNPARRAGGPTGRAGETRKERSHSEGAEEGAPAAAHHGPAPTALHADLAPDAQALLDKATRLVDSHVLGTAQTLPMTPAPSVADCGEADTSAARSVPGAAGSLRPSPQKPLAANLVNGEAKPVPSPEVAATAAVRVALESDYSGPAPLPPPVVEELPAAIMRPSRETPRVPTAVVGSSIGAYRMLRPSEPEVLTPRPAARAPEQVGASRPGLSLGGRPRRSGGVSTPTPVPLTRTPGVDADLPGDAPEPRTPGGTLLGMARPAK